MTENGVPVTTIEYEYNDRGIRVGKTVNGDETRYLIDELQPYAQVIEQYDGETDGLEVAYTYGEDLIAQVENGETTYYHLDGLGSTRLLTDETGVAVERFSYDAYGNLMVGDPMVADYLFAGEQRDIETGLDYLRARYYDPSLGRFISRDAYSGSLEDPMSQHKYQYAHANPVVNTDPSGYVTLQEFLAAAAIHTTLAGLSFTTGAAVGTLTGGGSLSDAVSLYDQFFAGMTDSLTFGRSTEARRLLYGNEATKNHKGLFFNLGRFSGGMASIWIGSLATTIGAAKTSQWWTQAALGYDIYGGAEGITDVFQKWKDKQKLTLWDSLAFLPTFGWFNINYKFRVRGLASIFGDISIVKRGAEGRKLATGNSVLAELETGSPGDFIVEASKPSSKGRYIQTHVYENPGHHLPGSSQFKPKKSILPDNHVELFYKSVPFKDKEGRIIRYAVDESGNIHRFEPSLEARTGASETVYHWSGSENGQTLSGKKIGLHIPSEVRKRLRK